MHDSCAHTINIDTIILEVVIYFNFYIVKAVEMTYFLPFGSTTKNVQVKPIGGAPPPQHKDKCFPYLWKTPPT